MQIAVDFDELRERHYPQFQNRCPAAIVLRASPALISRLRTRPTTAIAEVQRQFPDIGQIISSSNFLDSLIVCWR